MEQPRAAVGSGDFQWDAARERFTGRIRIDSFEYPIEALPHEDTAGITWNVTVFQGAPFGAYRFPHLDD